MTEPTHKELAAAQRTITLLVNPGTPHQRAWSSCYAQRADHQANAVRKASERHPGAALAWRQADGTLTPVLPN
jgi:hypothetical protein